MSSNDRFLKACRGEATDCTPIWLMRQAGRYMEEYRALREKHDILEIIKTPELAVEVTLQPILAFDLDAAIIFADILPLLQTMGLELEFVKGEGPVIHNPLRRRADIERLQQPAVRDSLSFTLTAISLARRELSGRVPLIGFSGAPFTLAAYAIEGSGSRDFRRAKTLMYEDPFGWDLLMAQLAERVGEYLKAQAEAGAQALQMFDTWSGELAPQDYRQRVLPYSRRAIAIAMEAGVPVIHFTRGTGGYLELVAEAGGDAMSIDWRVDIGEARRRIGSRALQGNLDPIALLAPWPALKESASAVLESARGMRGHVFNLGHGILPETPRDNVARLVDFVHEATRA